MSSNPSLNNNCNRPLSADASGNTFTGPWESSSGALVLAVFVASPTLGLVTIQQSNNRGTSVQLTDTYNIDGAALDAMNVFRVPSGFASFRVIFHNYEGNQTYLSLNTYLEDFYTSNSVTATISGVVDISGNTYDVSSNLLVNVADLPINRSPPNLPSSNTLRCSVDGWTAGNSIPIVIDTDGNTIKIDQTSSATNGVSIVGPLDASGNVLTSAPLTTYPYASATYPVEPQGLAGCKIMGMNGGYETWLVDGGYLPVSITEANGNTIKIDQSSVDTCGVIVAKPLPEGTHTIGKVGIDQTNNGVKVNPTAVLAVRTQGLGNTALAIGGPGIVYGVSMINKSAVVPVWIKFYTSATAPTSSDTPFLIQYLENVAQYNLISHNDSFYNMPVVDVLWVRATLLSADNDDTDTGVDCEVSTFVGGL